MPWRIMVGLACMLSVVTSACVSASYADAQRRAATPRTTIYVPPKASSARVTEVGLRIAECVRARLMDLPTTERYELLRIGHADDAAGDDAGP